MTSERRSGLLIPLFSSPSETSWGIGDIGDVRHVTSWLAAAGQRVLQLLPVGEMAPGQQSPYSAISAMAIDPIYVDIAAIPEFVAAGGERSLSPSTMNGRSPKNATPCERSRACRHCVCASHCTY